MSVSTEAHGRSAQFGTKPDSVPGKGFESIRFGGVIWLVADGSSHQVFAKVLIIGGSIEAADGGFSGQKQHKQTSDESKTRSLPVFLIKRACCDALIKC